MDLLPSVSVNHRLIKNQQPAEDEIPVAPAATGRDGTTFAEYPIGTVGPRVIQKIGQRKQVCLALGQYGSALIENHVPQVDAAFITR